MRSDNCPDGRTQQDSSVAPGAFISSLAESSGAVLSHIEDSSSVELPGDSTPSESLELKGCFLI